MSFRIEYSQNFLTSTTLINALLDRSSITQDDCVYEIGAGTGNLTKELSKRCHNVVAFEVDHKLYYQLQRNFARGPNVQIYHRDFLTSVLPITPYKVFASIPFHRTAEIIRKLTGNLKTAPADCYLVIQQEAAKRFTGEPTDRETYASLLLKPWFDTQVLYHFNPKDFQPAPSVSPVLLRIYKKQPVINTCEAQWYRDFIAYAFSQWKPTLMQGLQQVFTRREFVQLGKELRFKPDATTTMLSFEQWLKVFRYFLANTNIRKKQIVIGAEASLQKQQASLKKVHRTRINKNQRECY